MSRTHRAPKRQQRPGSVARRSYWKRARVAFRAELCRIMAELARFPVDRGVRL